MLKKRDNPQEGHEHFITNVNEMEVVCKTNYQCHDKIQYVQAQSASHTMTQSCCTQANSKPHGSIHSKLICSEQLQNAILDSKQLEAAMLNASHSRGAQHNSKPHCLTQLKAVLLNTTQSRIA